MMTESALLLHGISESIAAATCTFLNNVEDAVNAVIMTIQCGIPIARIDLLDNAMIDAIKL